MKALRITVNGRVQGVFFRASAKEVADQLNVKGFAQNQPDGSVYIEAAGADENLSRFVEWCRQGPPRAQVRHVDVRESELKNVERFEIRR
jgi:acylphosphatase